MHTIRLQSAQLTEVTLSEKTEEEGGCLKRVMCVMGVASSRGNPYIPVGGESSHQAASADDAFPRISLGGGLNNFRLILEEMVRDVAEKDEAAMENFPNIHQTVARYVQ